MSHAGNQPRGDAGTEAAADLAGDDDRGRFDLAKVRGLPSNIQTSGEITPGIDSHRPLTVPRTYQ